MFELSKKDADSDRGKRTGASVPGASGGTSPTRQSSSGAVIGRSIQINGDVKGDEDLLIEGDVSGTVELKNHSLTVGKEGKVKADIYARAITVDGTTDGDLFASERIAIRSSANVKGNLLAPRISLEDGARFKGAVEMDQQAVDKALGKVVSTAPKSESESQSLKTNGDAKPPTPQATSASSVRT